MQLSVGHPVQRENFLNIFWYTLKFLELNTLI